MNRFPWRLTIISALLGVPLLLVADLAWQMTLGAVRDLESKVAEVTLLDNFTLVHEETEQWAFFATRPNVYRIYSSDAEPAGVCEDLSSAVAGWDGSHDVQVDTGAEIESTQPGLVCHIGGYIDYSGGDDPWHVFSFDVQRATAFSRDTTSHPSELDTGSIPATARSVISVTITDLQT